MEKIDRQEKMEKARDLFLEGYNCAQAVFASYADEVGLTERQALKLSSGFGGGMGGMRSVCGAVSSMLMVAGAKKGYDEASDMEGKKNLYEIEQRMVSEFTSDYETINCGDLLKRHHIEASNVPSERTPEYYQKRPCARYVERCAGIVADELNRDVTE